MRKNILITGVKRRIGFNLAKIYKDKGYMPYGMCGEISDSCSNLGIEILDKLDFKQENFIDLLLSRVKQVQFDGIIHCNISRPQTQHKLTELDYNNLLKRALIPVELTKALQPQLNKGANIVFINSAIGTESTESYSSTIGHAIQSEINHLKLELECQNIATTNIDAGHIDLCEEYKLGDIPAQICAKKIASQIKF